MKTNPSLKLSLLFGFLFLMFVPKTSFAQAKDFENRYFYLYVSGTFTDNNTTYISDAIYYTTYEACAEGYQFQKKAKEAFSNYLKVNYNDVFRYGAGNNIQVVEYKQFSTSNFLKTRQEAYDRLTAFKAEQLDNNYKTLQTNFVYSCN